MKHWIKTSEANLEFLQSLDIKVGHREGNTFHDCTVPDAAIDDLLEHWGSGDDEDTVMFGAYRPAPVDRTVKLPKVLCRHCRCVLRADGACTYPFCEGKVETPPVRQAARLRA